MLISKKNRQAIYEYLFLEGVLVAKKDFNAPRHQDIDVPNLQVIKAMQSMESKGYVTSQFSWQYYYYYLTNEGIEYLREYLHLPIDIVPRTFIRSNKPVIRSSRFDDRPERRHNDDGYRRSEKKEGATGDYRPSFRGGAGRGAPRREA